MQIPFYKYHGTGNDFILIDNRTLQWVPNLEILGRWCHRRFGVGADGVILLQNHSEGDFEMVYFNSDGNPSSMCGNGGRCIVAFALFLGIIKTNQTTRFWAPDGWHTAIATAEDYVELEMQEVKDIEKNDDFYFLDTGSPHYVEAITDLAFIDVVQRGRAIRYNERFREEGTNVNFLEYLDTNSIKVATYERGVEDETYSCGTGSVACAIVHALHYPSSTIHVQTKGGDLLVKLESQNDHFTNIWLCGNAVQVFSGTLLA